MASGFICYDSYLRKTRNLSDGVLGKLFRALMSYHITGEIPEMDELVSVAFDFIREDLDDGDEKYKARCETNRQNRLSTKKSVSEEETGSEISEVSEVTEASKADDPSAEEDSSSDDDREPSLTIVDDRAQNKNQKTKDKNNNKNIKTKIKEYPPVSPPRGTGLTPLEGFEDFYGEFPLHISRPEAIRAWNSLRPALRGKIIAILEKQKKSDQGHREGGRFVPRPSSESPFSEVPLFPGKPPPAPGRHPNRSFEGRGSACGESCFRRRRP